MGKGTNSNSNTDVSTQIITWDEVHKHSHKDDRWLVIDGHVYDITRWSRRHPGGARILAHFAGQDATEAWTAMHNDKEYVSKFMKPLLVGRVEQEKSGSGKNELIKDFRKIRKMAEDKGWFKVNPLFFMAHLVHIIGLELLTMFVLYYFGTGWIPFCVGLVLMATAQAQAGWTQHDYGHQSVFNSSRANHLMHHFVIGFYKGASSHWWNFRHFQHHVKPNVYKKDPDITIPALFLIGDKIPKQWGQRKRGYMPYNFQHDYFWFFGPMFLLPVWFHLEVMYFIIKRRDWMDIAMTFSFFVRYFGVYAPMIGVWQSIAFYLLMRVLEGHWFVFVTQMSHIPMEVDADQDRDWVSSQMVATCNVDPSVFNDWFTGHLNYQIEHHLFPTMPRHNYEKVAPYIQELCSKHKLTYTSKPLMTAFADILKSLKKSGDIWYHAYHE